MTKLIPKKILSLPVEEFGKIYNSANDDEKTVIARLAKIEANEFISEARSFINEVKSQIRLEQMHEVAV